MIALGLGSCTRTSMSPVIASSFPPVKTTSGGPGGGGGANGGGANGGGGIPAPVTNLSIYTKQLIGTWDASIGIAVDAPTIVLQIIFKANGNYSLLTTDNGTGAQTTGSGNWQFTIPANTPLHESGLLVMTSGVDKVLSGFAYFVRPGVLEYSTTVNNLAPPLKGGGFIFQKN
jgi:hypothetical protein